MISSIDNDAKANGPHPEKPAESVGVHSYKGLVSLQAVLAGTINHIAHHIKFIDEKWKVLGE